MGRLIKTDGSEEQVSPDNGEYFTLEEMQKYVGGYIEIVTLPSGDSLVLNEDGKLQRLPANKRATLMGRAAGTAHNDTIVGDVLVCSRKEME